MNSKVLLRWSLVFFLILILNCDAAKMMSMRNLIFVRAQRMMRDRVIDLAAIEQIDLHLVLADSSMRRILAQLYVSGNHPDVAIKLLLGDAQTCASILNCFYLGEALYRTAKREDALSIWRKVKDVDVYFALKGDASYTQENGEEEAVQYYALSWEISTSPTKQKRTMLLNLCRDSRSKGELQTAVSWCQNAVVANRDYWTLVELGRTFYESGSYQSAESILAEAVSLAPDRGGAYYWLGITLSRLGRSQEGLAALYNSVRLDPNNVWSRLDFAEKLASQGEYVSAACEYLAARELTERDDLLQKIEENLAKLPVDTGELSRCNR